MSTYLGFDPNVTLPGAPVMTIWKADVVPDDGCPIEGRRKQGNSLFKSLPLWRLDHVPVRLMLSVSGEAGSPR